MASFTSRQRTTSEGHGEMTKYPIMRLEISIKNFIKVLSIALDRLHKHSVNIKRLTAMEDWPELHKEQVNATRTVQQITANIKEIEKVRCQVKEEDLHVFDERVSQVKTEAVAALDEFLVLLGGEGAQLGVNQKTGESSSESGKGDLPPMNDDDDNHLLPPTISSPKPSITADPPPPSTTTATTSLSSSCSLDQDPLSLSSSIYATTTDSNNTSSSQYTKNPGAAIHHSTPRRDGDHDVVDCIDHDASAEQADADSVQTPLLVTSNLHVIPENSEASASWEQLRENIEDLNELVHVFAENVEQQGETINCIEDNIDSAHDNVTQGTSHLGMASKYKAAMFPAVGAVLGGVLGGPVGFLAGMKIGGLAAVTGGAVGYAGGKYIKKRQDKIVEMEMSSMSHNHQSSLSSSSVIPEKDDHRDRQDGDPATSVGVGPSSSHNNSRNNNNPGASSSSSSSRRSPATSSTIRPTIPPSTNSNAQAAQAQGWVAVEEHQDREQDQDGFKMFVSSVKGWFGAITDGGNDEMAAADNDSSSRNARDGDNQ